MCKNFIYLVKFVELCFKLYYKNVAHILAILYGNFRFYRVNRRICLRKYKTNNINKLFINFLLRTCATRLYYVISLLPVVWNTWEERCGCNLIRRIDFRCFWSNRMKASCYFRAPNTGEHFTSGFTSGLSLRNNNTFFKTMAGSVCIFTIRLQKLIFI